MRCVKTPSQHTAKEEQICLIFSHAITQTQEPKSQDRPKRLPNETRQLLPREGRLGKCLEERESLQETPKERHRTQGTKPTAFRSIKHLTKARWKILGENAACVGLFWFILFGCLVVWLGGWFGLD